MFDYEQMIEKVKVIELKNVCFCFHDMYEMTKYPRGWFKRKPELQAGTNLTVKQITRNDYGTFFTCVAPNFIDCKKFSIETYDIPVYSASIVEWKER